MLIMAVALYGSCAQSSSHNVASDLLKNKNLTEESVRSCSPDSKGIRLNTDLAKKPPDCLEYIVVHEMIHLMETTHNNRFMTLMD